ncbi:MAG: hypothetical protein LBF86_01920 [Helicobacteraceae bacterium]|jgi:hypothetical protein|nr:hypothetical protein [Helicobacteraceae bacterium]
MREKYAKHDIFVHIDGDRSGVEEKAREYYVDFLASHSRGEGAVLSDFLFFSEKEIDFNKQNDITSDSHLFALNKRARLTLHFDYDRFSEANDERKYKIVLNAILYLLNYWRRNLKIPKNVRLDKAIDRYEKKLKADNLFDKTLEKIYIKPDNLFRLNFVRRYFYSINDKDILFSVNNIEKYLNNNLYKYQLAGSIKEAFFHYDIFDFNDPRYERYIDGVKPCKLGDDNDLYMIEQYDSIILKNAAKEDQIIYLSEGLLNAAKRAEKMKQKPKEFNADKFYKTLKELMNNYVEKA